jgi:hypothetical protein
MKYRRKFIRKFEKVYTNKTRYSLVPVRRYPRIKKEDRVEVKVKKEPINPSLVFTKKRAFFLANKAKASIYKKRYIHKTIEITNPKYDAEAEILVEKYRYKLDLIDEGWLTYITKKLDGKDFKNLYLP